MTRLRAIAAALLLFACGAALAQAWPARPIRLVIAFPPGGPADIIGRAVAQKLGEALGQPIVVDNRPGGNANIGAEAAARSTPDGYTLFLATSTHATNAKRSTALPDVPAIAEAGLAHYELASWFGLMAPAGTPAQAVARVNQESNRILATPEFGKRLDAEGGDAAPASAEVFGRFVRGEIERWAAVVRRTGAQAE